MNSTNTQSAIVIIGYILIMALTTYLIRMIPLVFCKKEIKNRIVKQFLFYIPYTVLAAMTFPAIFFITNNPLCGIIAAIAAIICAYFEKSLVFVASIACLTVFISELIINALNII